MLFQNAELRIYLLYKKDYNKLSSNPTDENVGYWTKNKIA
jgi:hypothetical protein